MSASTAQAAGTATVQLKRRPSVQAPNVQVLKKVRLVNGTGQSVTKLRRTMSRGTYYLYVTFTYGASKQKAVATRKVTIR